MLLGSLETGPLA